MRMDALKRCMKGVSDMNKDILEKIKQSQDAYLESSRLRSNAKTLECDAIYDIFKARGILLGETIVKNKQTGRRGILRITSEGGISPGLFFNVSFYPITKKGTESTKQSYADRGKWWRNYEGESFSPEGQYRGFEAMADCYDAEKGDRE